VRILPRSEQSPDAVKIRSFYQKKNANQLAIPVVSLAREAFS
jgi:hypothetical protein